MTRTRSLLILASWLATVALVTAQERPKPSDTHPPGKNPHLNNKASIRTGMTQYRVRCGDCHGLDAAGYRGPDLTAVMAAGATDERLFQVIRKGVPGTEMPSTTAPDEDVLMIIAYLRNLGGAAPADKVTGNVDNGAKIFASNCSACHRTGPASKGGRIGPDLGRIGAARSRAALAREIRTPSEWIAPGFEPVTIVTKDGQRVRGVKKNEDVISIQIMDVRERLQGYLRKDLQNVIDEPESLMPAYGPQRLSDSDLNDLIGYLTTLRASQSSSSDR
jgi:putative heme-binding domain-containing protein